MYYVSRRTWRLVLPILCLGRSVGTSPRSSSRVFNKVDESLLSLLPALGNVPPLFFNVPVLPIECERDLLLFGRWRSSMASSLMNSLKKYGLQFLQSWYRTNQSPICPLLRMYSRHFLMSSSYLLRTVL